MSKATNAMAVEAAALGIAKTMICAFQEPNDNPRLGSVQNRRPSSEMNKMVAHATAIESCKLAVTNHQENTTGTSSKKSAINTRQIGHDAGSLKSSIALWNQVLVKASSSIFWRTKQELGRDIRRIPNAPRRAYDMRHIAADCLHIRLFLLLSSVTVCISITISYT